MLNSFTKRKPSPAKPRVALAISEQSISLAQATEDGNVAWFDSLKTEQADQHPQLLKQLCQKHQINEHPCTWILYPNQYYLLLTDAIEVPDNELAQAARWKVKDLIDISINDALIDVFKIPGFGAGRMRKKMYVAATLKSYIQRYVEMIEGQGLQLDTISIAEFALRNILLRTTPDHQGMMVLCVHDPECEIVVLYQEDIYLIRRIKSVFPNKQSDDNVKQEFYQRITLELQRSYDYCISELGFSPPSQLKITPHANLTQEFCHTLQQQLHLPTSVMSAKDILPDTSKPLKSELYSSIFAIGGVMEANDATS